MAPDLTLLEQYVATRDGDALAAIMQRHQGLVYGTCMRILGNTADAEDAAQECFIRLVRHAHRVRFSLAGWLHRCATRVSLNARKQAGLRQHHEHRYAQLVLAENGDERTWHDLAPHLDRALTELPPEHLHVLIQQYLLQRSGTEIAREMNISRVTLYRRLDEGIRMLRQKLRVAGVVLAIGVLEVLLEEHAAASAPPALADGLARLANTLGRTGREGAAMPRPRALARGTVGRSLAGTLVGALAGILVTGLIVGGVAYEMSARGRIARLLGPGARRDNPPPAQAAAAPPARPAENGALASAVEKIASAPPEVEPAPVPLPAPTDPNRAPDPAAVEDEDDGPWRPFWITPDSSPDPAAPVARTPSPAPTTAPAKVAKKREYPFAPPDIVASRIEAINLARRAEEAARKRVEKKPRRTPAGPLSLRLSVTKGGVSPSQVHSTAGTGFPAPQPITVKP